MKTCNTAILAALLTGCFSDVPSGTGSTSEGSTGGTSGDTSGLGTTSAGPGSTSGPATDSGGSTGDTGGAQTASGPTGGTTGTTGSTGGPGSSSSSTGGGSSSGGIEPTVEDLQPCDSHAECFSGNCYLPEGLGGSPQGFCLRECFNSLDCPEPEPGTNVACLEDPSIPGFKGCYKLCPDPGFVNYCPDGWLCYDVGITCCGQSGVCFPYP